jgi:hypothetical protein
MKNRLVVTASGAISRLGLLVMALMIFPVVMLAQRSDTTIRIAFAGDSKTSTFAFDWRNGMIFLPVRVAHPERL